MNWRLILLLSLFGLAMGYLTVSILPSNIENIVWLVICIFYGIMVALNCSKNLFWNGFMISIVNSVWITILHVAFFETYMKNHAEMAKQMDWFGMQATHPKLEMILTGPVIGIIFGIVIGILSVLAGLIFKKKTAASNS